MASQPKPSTKPAVHRGLPARMFQKPAAATSSAAASAAAAPAASSAPGASATTATAPSKSAADSASGVDYRKFVVNLKSKPRPRYDVYVGRPNPTVDEKEWGRWGNPFVGMVLGLPTLPFPLFAWSESHRLVCWVVGCPCSGDGAG